MTTLNKDVTGKYSGGFLGMEGQNGSKGKDVIRLCNKLANKLTDDWAINDKMNQLKRVYRLKKQDGEAYQELSGKQINQNESIITFLRADNRVKHILQEQHENGDERVIKLVFENDREERLSLQRYTASEAIGEMDQKSKEAVKVLNALRYESDKRERKLRDLDNKYQGMLYLEQKSAEQLDAEQTSTQLENSLDKALIKYDTATMITHRYREILDSLKDDSLTMPARLDAMEQALIEQKKELAELKQMAKEATGLRNEARKDLQQYEHESIETRRQREAELMVLRKEVERRKIDTDKSEKKYFKSSFLSDQQDMIAQGEQQQKRERQKRILTYEEAIHIIKEMTHVTAIGDVVNRVISQQETKAKLSQSISELEGQKNRLTDEQEKLKVHFHDLKYTGNRKLSKAQMLLEKTRENLDAERRRRDRILDSVERCSVTMVNLKAGVPTLLDKLSEIKLPPPHFSYTKSMDVYDQMDLTRKKLDHLMKGIESQDVEYQNAKEIIVSSEFQDYLETQLPPGNTCIKFDIPKERNVSEFRYDSQENEVLSRTDIKNMCQKLVLSMEKKKKKKNKGRK